VTKWPRGLMRCLPQLVRVSEEADKPVKGTALAAIARPEQEQNYGTRVHAKSLSAYKSMAGQSLIQFRVCK